MACATCQPIDCVNPSDLGAYSLQSGLFFSSIQYGFVMDCPAGYTCAPGYYPRTITYPPGDNTITVPEDIVEDGELTEPYLDSLECCDTPIDVQAPAGTSIAELESIINSAFEACAEAKAACEILQPPAPGVPAPTKGENKLRMSLTNSKACLSVAYGASLLAVAATGRVFWKIVSGALPTGLTLQDQTGFTPAQTQSIGISGTPTVAGNYTFMMMISDSLGYTLTKTITIYVLGITNTPTTATVGTPYSFQFTTAGGTGPYTFSVLAAALPLGLTLSASGLLSGTPENGDQNTFNLTVTDSTGSACIKQFVMTPDSGSCSVNITTINWHTQENASASGANGTFSNSAGQFESKEIKLFGIITNNTGFSYDIKLTAHWTGTCPQGQATMFLMQGPFELGNIITFISHAFEATFEDTLDPTITIPPGDSEFGLFITLVTADVPAVTDCSGTLVVSCV